MAGLLKGVKVVELSVLLTADYVGLLLGDQGADIIKLESPPGGDYLRLYMGQLKPNWSPSHVFANRNKRSLTLNLRTPEAHGVLKKVLADADVFITGSVGDIPKKLGVDYESLKKIKPDIVYCHVTGFGTDGPFATLPAHGMMMGAIVGGTPMTIDEENNLPYLDPLKQTATSTATNGAFMGSIFAALGVAEALVRKERTGQGAYLDIAAADTVVAAQWNQVNRDLNIDRISYGGDTLSEHGGAKEESKHAAAADYNYYRAGDGKFVIFCAQEVKFWENFCRAVGREDLLDAKERIGNGMALRNEIQAILEKHPQQYWTDFFIEHNIAAGPIVDIKDMPTHPYAQSRGILKEYQHPVAGPFVMVTDAVKVPGEEFELRHHAPSVGEHTDEVLAELGYTPGQISGLREQKAV